MIHIIDRQTERILDVLVNQSDSKIYWDTKMTEAIEDNVLIFEFRMLADSPAAKYLIPKNKLTAQDQDGFHRLFIIDSVETTHDANGKILFVSALGDHIELASDEPIPPQTLAGQTAETAVQFVLANTRYVPGQIDFAGSRTITFDTYINPLAALQKIASEFELELRFRVTVNPDGTITRIVDLLKPDDLFDGKEIVFGKDMTGIRRKENTENICTRLIGVGPADEDGNLVTFASVNGGKIYVEDEEAYQRWNNAGRHIWGIFEFQPEEGTEVTPQQLLDATKKEMEKRKNSAVEWEVQAAALEQVIGLEHERVRVGMNVRIKDEAFDPPIYLEARVLETEMPELDDPNGNFSYTFGNYRQVTVVVPPEVKAIQKTLFKNANSWTAAKSIAAQALADAAKAQETADGKITSFYQPDPPVTASEGDLWFDTDDGNKPYIWQNGQWVNAQDSGIAEALNRANDAQATADKKVQTFFSETQPTAEGIGDLWYNPASGALFRWSGSAWELVSDVTGRNTAADTAKVGGKPSITVLNDITAAQQAAEEARQQIQDVQQGLSDLDQYVDGAFKDGVIQESEAKAIEKYLNQLNTEKADVDTRYNTVYNDANLTGTAKTNLANAKSSYNTAHTNLVNSINSAIADGKVTSTEKADVDAKFSAYRSALATLSQRFEEAIRAIEQAKATQAENNAKTYTDQNAVKKGTLYNGVSISETDGFKVTRSDQLVQGVFNATEGIRFQTRPNTSSSWQDDFYYDVNSKRFKFAGELEGASGIFKGSLIAQDPSDNSGHPSKTEITYDTFSRQVHYAEDEYWTSVLIGSRISMNKYDYSGLFGPKPNAYISGGFSISEEGINFGVRSASPSGWYSVTIDLDGIHYSDPNDVVFKEILFRDTDIAFNTNINVTGSIIASNGWFDGQVFELSNASLLNIYIRPQSGGSVRFTAAGTTTSFVPIYTSNVFTTSVDINTGGTHLYARPSSSGNLKVTAAGTVDVWRPVEAESFQNRSLERYKQDIELWNGSALDIIRNSEIYQYRLKTDVQNGIDKLKYGFIIGEGYQTPNEVITPSGESVDIYAQSSVAWKAIQELDSMQMNHEDRIAQLEQKFAELEAKIS